MGKEYNLEIKTGLKFDSNFKLLKRFNTNDYDSIFREIKINCLLGKKSRFSIEEINSFYIDCNDCNDVRLKDVIAKANKIIIDIDKNLIIKEIIVDLEFLETSLGITYSKYHDRLKLFPKNDYYTGIYLSI
jgi:hypothetical protein